MALASPFFHLKNPFPKAKEKMKISNREVASVERNLTNQKIRVASPPRTHC